MTFEEVLNEAVALLQRQGRLSYRALKRQFDLNDDYLEDLKDAILFAHPVVDETGRGLVWTGAVDLVVSEPAPNSPSPTQQEVVSETSPAQREHRAAKLLGADAERRQLTVMFCDLADSTHLSGQLDPEDLRDVIRAYQSTSAAVIERFDGYIAQHLGDGLMVYFGWPQAHEDDAQRAAHAGLGIVDALQELNDRLEQEKGIRLTVRIGVHTGLVVVGDVGTGFRQERLALGETPNVASRIEGLATPDTIAISAATYQLVQGYFVCEELGFHRLKGVDDPQAIYRVVGASGKQSRLEVAATQGLTPLMGREQEVGLLAERWQQVQDGQGQVIVLSGEAGIGKSRLLQVLKDQIGGDAHTLLECRSSPYFQNTALYPITEMLQHTLQWQQDDSPQTKLAELEQVLNRYDLAADETVPLFAALLALPLPESRYSPLKLSPQQQRQRTLETMVALLLQQAAARPLLFVVEDLHWTDPSTLELLGLLIEQTPGAAICVLMTCRPTFQAPWSSRSYLTQMTLNRLSRAQIEQVAEWVAGDRRLSVEILQQIVAKTDGVPLFVEEMTKAILAAEFLTEGGGHYELTGPIASVAIPATLQDALMARLDRLGATKGIAQLGAAIGRQFSYALIRVVSPLDDLVVWQGLVQLVEAGLLYQQGSLPQATFTFKHALIQDAAYQSLLRRTRQQLHGQIAQVLETQFAEVKETQPELLASHYTEVGFLDRAISYWQQAGEQAVKRSANAEAIAYLTKGLAILKTLPDCSERALQELTLQRTLGVPLLSTKGFGASEVESTYARARELCLQIEDTSHIFPILFGLWGFYESSGRLKIAREIAEELLFLAERQNDPALILQAHRALGDTLCWLGEFTSALDHLGQGIRLYDPQQHRDHAIVYGQDPGVGCRIYAANVLWALGYPDQALLQSHEAVRLAQTLNHPFSLAFALNITANTHRWRGEWQLFQERSEELLALATEHGFVHRVAQAKENLGYISAWQGNFEEGMVQMRQALQALTESNSISRSGRLLRRATLYHKIGQAEEGLQALVDSMALAYTSGERWWEAERYRLKGELPLAQSADHSAEAETCFHQALDIARQQQAKSLELRAATSLSRLWQSQGKRQDAYDLLAPVYNWFTEGFDTADLQEAKALLNDLEGQ